MTHSDPYSDLNVLYLEDEPLIAFDTARHLEELGFSRVQTVYRLDAAEQAAESVPFHLAILDINVNNGLTSIDLGRKLREKGVPVIFASGNGANEEQLRDDGFLFVGKPFPLQVLTRTIQTGLSAN